MGIIFFAPWCMHHWASIITNASSHMQHSIVHWTFYHRVAPALQSCNLGVHHYPPSSICTMGEPFYLYSLVWWHCTGIKKHVLCNSSDNIILSKDIPKTPPKPFFRFTLTCYSWALWWISMPFALLVLRSLRCEGLITLSQHYSLLCLTFSSWIENLTSLNYLFYSKSLARIESGCFLKSSSSSGGVPDCM